MKIGDMMKSIFTILMLLSILLLITSCSYINSKLGWADDHIGEELVESAIEGKTGLDVDLTPTTKE